MPTVIFQVVFRGNMELFHREYGRQCTSKVLPPGHGLESAIIPEVFVCVKNLFVCVVLFLFSLTVFID